MCAISSNSQRIEQFINTLRRFFKNPSSSKEIKKSPATDQIAGLFSCMYFLLLLHNSFRQTEIVGFYINQVNPFGQVRQIKG